MATTNKMTNEEIRAEIRIREQLLNQSDYKALKHADGVITDEEYAETKALRQGWRDEINDLESQLEPEE